MSKNGNLEGTKVAKPMAATVGPTTREQEHTRVQAPHSTHHRKKGGRRGGEEGRRRVGERVERWCSSSEHLQRVWVWLLGKESGEGDQESDSQIW